MNFIKLALVCATSFASAHTSALPLFSDDFESGSLNQWQNVIEGAGTQLNILEQNGNHSAQIVHISGGRSGLGNNKLTGFSETQFEVELDVTIISDSGGNADFVLGRNHYASNTERTYELDLDANSSGIGITDSYRLIINNDVSASLNYDTGRVAAGCVDVFRNGTLIWDDTPLDSVNNIPGSPSLSFGFVINLNEPDITLRADNITLKNFSIPSQSTYYVSPDGNDNNPGTESQPFKTLQHGINQLSAGNTLLVRGGRYNESVIASGLTGSSASPVVIQAYPDEYVFLDGTRPISELATGSWSLASQEFPGTTHIYKIQLNQDIHQLFDDGEMMIPARWPNAFLHDGSIWDREQWARGDDSLDTNGTMVADATIDDNGHDLAASGIDLTGAMGILNVGNWLTATREITSHTSGENTFTYNPVNFTFQPQNHYFYAECKLELLDAEREWFYDIDTGMLYLWSPGGGMPDGDIRGKVLSYAFNISDSQYVRLDGFNFFGAAFRYYRTTHSSVKNCDLNFPSCSKRMLKQVGHPDICMIEHDDDEDPSSCTVYNVTIRNTDSDAFYSEGNSNVLENCMFENIDFSATELRGMMFSVTMQGSNSVARRNTLRQSGASATFSFGRAPIAELNRISHTGFLQSDGSLIQLPVAMQDGAVLRYNWLLDTIKYGQRFDAINPIPTDPSVLGTNGVMHHNVGRNCNGGFMIKGNGHTFAFNTAMGSDIRNDVIIFYEGGSAQSNSIFRNNAVSKMSLHRKNNVLPELDGYDHNWNGYTFDPIQTVNPQLIDPDSFDFRPAAGSDLIDAGIAVPGIPESYLGTAPDIGAYEAGSLIYWIPGYQAPEASAPIPADGALEQPLNRDLIYLIGREGIQAEIYLGTDPAQLAAITTQTNPTNIVNLADLGSPLTSGTTYHWRVDTIKADSSVVTGSVWQFTTEGIAALDLPSYDGFENGWGNWSNTGIQTAISSDPAWASSGSNAVHIKDDEAGSILMLNSSFDASAYSSLTLDFSFIMDSMDPPDEAFIEYFDGTDWLTIYTIGQPHGHINGTNYQESVTVVSNRYAMPVDACFRFRNGGAGPADHMYYDDIHINGSHADNYQNWLAVSGLSESNSNPLADLEPDGMDNFTEYALGGNPTSNDAHALLPVSRIIDLYGEQQMQVVYRRRTDHEERSLNYALSLSTNLIHGNWTPVNASEERTGSAPTGFETVTNHVPISTNQQQFIRLEISEELDEHP
ncbi:DUF1565 domain-containing protein [Pontiella agarivorans]|uniref:DUF1565 domain-containing protein n=1 Tax=Pontiella agarivorans TaxID=3038953 RepID=A0ABU5MY73_9BACT|nr:DUF1565 domain-containing protein [Pontiella agarivorans]MDZ8119149.1 DUF1565 domain-containing protein [Pontiella agarivorans]